MAIFFPGDATTADVVSPKKFSSGILTNTSGTAVNRGAVTLTPSQSAQTIAAGFHNGSGTVPAVVFDATKVLNDTTIAGKTGTMPNITAGADPAIGIGQWGDGGLAVYPSEGYRKGGAGAGEIKVSIGQLQSTVAGLTASNVRRGTVLMGLTGTLAPTTRELVNTSGTAVAFGNGTTAFTIGPCPTGYSFTGFSNGLKAIGGGQISLRDTAGHFISMLNKPGQGTTDTITSFIIDPAGNQLIVCLNGVMTTYSLSSNNIDVTLSLYILVNQGGNDVTFYAQGIAMR
ncbi:hypothetical protein H1230_09315 [Paenibacillus sp. 19GGS1-52]|uniref:hypothetical protein n=1 Tax=Paenibacillus sp. 19GGS1-52 TaxID=2758563 RepID=UPI001EFB48C9|nr:hypothetical protein [Paenibacillus sp. 19GGS1-52]ULO08945.1 hypothetical protein H1230_09315 [Paenibacillus sp. 19GGS1-52]